jgi:uncharacterized membrane protein
MQQIKAAWGAASPGEPRWPASLAVVATMILYLSLPENLTLGPTWIVPALAALLLVPLSIVAPRRRPDETRWQGLAAVAIIALINVANAASLLLLIHLLLHGSRATGGQLLVEAIKIWLTNVMVFGLWYWELDRGGPDDRSSNEHRQPDFLFPQMTTPGSAPSNWTPSFLDYLYLAFTNATAFSPTDTMPLTPMAKVLMLIQALISFLTVGLVAARAVNILG